jgi:uncharacterized protein (TIGR00369 family)
MFFGLNSPFVDHCFITEIERSGNGFRARIELRSELTNSFGGAHGGVIATLLDGTMTAAARYATHPDGLYPVGTVDLSISYIGQAKSIIDCLAKLTARQGRTLYMEGSAWNEENALIARATSTMRMLSIAK